MSFAPKSGLPSEPMRRADVDDKPASNLYTGVFGNSNRADADSPFTQVKTIDSLAATIREMCATTDFNFSATARFIADGLLDFYSASGVAIAVEETEGVVCCASAGDTAPEVGTPLNIGTGISGVCYRTGQSQYCHDARRDERVDYASCQALGILSILISPVLIGDKTVGLVEVFSPEEFFFDRTDIVALESIATLVAKAHVRRLTAPTPPQATPSVTEVPKAFAAAAVAVAPAPAVAPPAPAKIEVSAPVLVPASGKGSAATATTSTASATSAPGVTERSAALTELLATNAARPAQSTAQPKSLLNPTNLVLIAAALLLLVGGGWYGSRTLLRPAIKPAPAATVQPAPAVTTPAVVPLPASTLPSTKAADKKTTASLPTVAKPVSKPVATSSPAEVVDLLAAPGSTKTVVPVPAPQNADAAPEAPSLGAVRSNLNLAAVATTTTTSVPRLTRSSNAEPEVLLRKVAPIYPPMARSAHINGEVVVRMTIGVDGNVKNAVVEKGPPMLRGAVVDAVRQWKYKPYRLDGTPQEVETTVTVKFQ